MAEIQYYCFIKDMVKTVYYIIYGIFNKLIKHAEWNYVNFDEICSFSA